MSLRIGRFVSAIVLCLSCISPLAVVAAVVPACSLCIVEVQTRGQNGEEDQDFVIVANVTAGSITSSSIQLRYSNSLGILDSTLGIGTFTAGQVKIYASDSLKTVNANAIKLPMALYSGGGTLQIARTSGATTTIYDRVGWGNALLTETIAAPAVEAGTILTRKNQEGVVQDTDSNIQDFEAKQTSCTGPEFNEIQPFVTDQNGQTATAWVELIGHSAEAGDCKLLTATGDSYTIPADSLPLDGEIAVIDSGVDASKQTVALRLGDSSGQLWLASASTYGGLNALNLPITTRAYTNLIKGQTWADIEGEWKRTYQPTPGNENIFRESLVVEQDDLTACTTIYITELLPNPSGGDTDHEWLELHNDSETSASLAQCQITIDGTVYYFLPDDSLAPQEWRVNYSLYDANGAEKTVSLRNSGENLIAFGSHTGTLQAFAYTDAPEGQSWARFTEGWRWFVSPTPGLDNTVAPPYANELVPTEFPIDEVPNNLDPTGGTEQIHLPLTITELLPNPGPPQTDENDEFAEIYNPNPTAINLKGYKIQTGNTYGNSYTFSDRTVEPGGYIVITSGTTSLSLANSGGRARLLTPAGQTVSETDTYGTAASGQAWAFIDNKWQWTNSSTPGAVNTYVAIPLLTTASTTKKKASTSKSTAAKKTTPKTPSTKTSTKKARVKAASTTPKATNGPVETASNAPPLHASVLAIVGALAVGYALYEYRRDIANRIYQFNRYRRDRRAAREAAKGR